jgi:diacylglycerol kinase family enzyme
MSGKYDLVAAAGGDGAAHDAAAGLAGGNCPLGIIPLGTGNVLAREIGLSFAPADIARTLLTGPVKPIHLGLANGEPFLFVTGIGFDAAAARAFEASGHRKLGRAGFVWPVLHALATAKNTPLHISADGAKHEAAWVIVTRVRHYAAGILLAPDASLFDNHLHAILFTGSGPLARIRDLSAMLSGQLQGNRHVRRLTARNLVIEGPPDTPVQIDGEVKGRLPLTLGIYPRKLPLIFPA